MSAVEALHDPAAREARGEVDFALLAREGAEGRMSLDALVDGVTCGACVARIERALARLPGLETARVNLTAKRLHAEWRGPAARANEIAGAVDALGFALLPFDSRRAAQGAGGEDKALLRALAVAGFGFANVMLLSVSLWSGAEMGPASHALLQYFSAAIALPAILYAIRPFARSALGALARRRTNMDVPITLGVALATAMSFPETLRQGPHIYFDAALALLFFLLVGRALDRRARGQALAAAERLLALAPAQATVLDDEGRGRPVPIERVRPGDRVLVTPGARVPVDGTVESGASELDTSLLTGETVPASAAPGVKVFAGTLNLSGALTLVAGAIGADTLLAEIARLMDRAQQGRARYVALADRIARVYAPAVHALALATFLFWWQGAGLAWQDALMIAVTVLIITCPCALALAVPVVQIVASGRLFRAGILLKSPTALERLAHVDTVVFDKTGTLTLARPRLMDEVDGEALAVAVGLARASRHPLSRALARAAPDGPVAAGVREHAGLGLAAETPQGTVRLGSRAFCGVAEAALTDGPELWLARPGHAPVRFAFEDEARADAAATVAALKARGYRVALLSGDRAGAVARAAAALGIADWHAGASPADKCACLAALAAEGRRVLMVGDGLNDAPALAAAHVSLSPAAAADISRTAADAVFQGERLGAVVELLHVAAKAERRVKANFALAIGYNALFVPVAMAGLVTPLLAAVAMSSSSLLVTLVALTLRRA